MPRKGENIYKRKDNRWKARYIKGHTSDGRAQYGYCYARSYREVKEKAAKARIVQQMPAPQRAGKTLSTYCDEWLTLIRNSAAESTIVKYTSVVNKHIRPSLGHIPLAELTSVQVEEFSHDLLEQQKLSPKTVRDILGLLRTILITRRSTRRKRYPRSLFSTPKRRKGKCMPCPARNRRG